MKRPVVSADLLENLPLLDASGLVPLGNTIMDSYVQAIFFPHTEASPFPTVLHALGRNRPAA